LRLDARTRPAADYIARCVAALQAGAWAGVAGPQTAVGQTPAAQAHALALNHPLGTGFAAYRRTTRPRPSETLYLGAYRTDWLRRVGGWDASLAATEDYELNLRIRHQGGRLLVDPTIRSTYLARASLRELAGQYYRYGAWRTVIRRRHRDAMVGRHGIPALFFPVLLLALLLTPLTVWPLLMVGAPLCRRGPRGVPRFGPAPRLALRPPSPVDLSLPCIWPTVPAFGRPGCVRREQDETDHAFGAGSLGFAAGISRSVMVFHIMAFHHRAFLGPDAG
jgi:hypothetical protein